MGRCHCGADVGKITSLGAVTKLTKYNLVMLGGLWGDIRSPMKSSELEKDGMDGCGAGGMGGVCEVCLV